MEKQKYVQSIESFTGIVNDLYNIKNNKYFILEDEITKQNIIIIYNNSLDNNCTKNDRITVIADVRRNKQYRIISVEALKIIRLPRIYNNELRKARGVLS